MEWNSNNRYIHTGDSNMAPRQQTHTANFGGARTGLRATATTPWAIRQ